MPIDTVSENPPNMDSIAQPLIAVPREQEMQTESTPVSEIDPSAAVQENARKVTTQMKDIAPRRNAPRNRQLPVRFRED